MSPQQLTSQNVAVIGGGAAGLAAAKELRHEGHTVVVFERESELGGTWVYNPQIESDPIGSDPNREIVHSSLYQSLRTNLARETMGFRDFPFIATGDAGRDSRRYPCHEEVLRYLLDFAHKFRLNELVRFETEVKQVKMENGKFQVRSVRGGENGKEEDETFDAVIVCKGRYSDPNIADIPGIEKWPGKQIHSHNYRVPQPYENLVVVIIGSSQSAEDISRELAGFAKEVHVASRSEPTNAFQKQRGCDNMWFHPMITNAKEDGSVVFDDGNTVFADIILHCTGYKYAFPFLDTIKAVTVDDSRVDPLYKHVFPPAFAPKLSFIGITWKTLPFPLFELQGKWIASVLSGRVSLPSQEDMMEDVEAFYSRLDDAGVPKRYTHVLGEPMNKQSVYFDWLATQCDSPPLEEWRKQIALISLSTRMTRLQSYREEWDEIEDVLVLEAQKDFAKYLTDTQDDAHSCAEPHNIQGQTASPCL